jgi:hypothetical protein
MSDQPQPENPPADRGCDTCQFMRQGPSYLRCCRYPPVTNPMHPMDPGSASGFPIVKPTDWCGEYQQA